MGVRLLMLAVFMAMPSLCCAIIVEDDCYLIPDKINSSFPVDPNSGQSVLNERLADIFNIARDIYSTDANSFLNEQHNGCIFLSNNKHKLITYKSISPDNCRISEGIKLYKANIKKELEVKEVACCFMMKIPKTDRIIVFLKKQNNARPPL